MKGAGSFFLRMVCAACCIGGAAAHAQFAPEDEVRLRRDEPLHFKDSVFRQGKAGEVFQVVKYDRASGRVFLLALDSDASTFGELPAGRR